MNDFILHVVSDPTYISKSSIILPMKTYCSLLFKIISPFLHSFLYLKLSFWIYFSTSYIIAFRNSLTKILLVLNSVNFSFPRYILSLKRVLLGVQFQVISFLFLSSTLGFYLLSYGLQVAIEKLAIILVSIPCG